MSDEMQNEGCAETLARNDSYLKSDTGPNPKSRSYQSQSFDLRNAALASSAGLALRVPLAGEVFAGECLEEEGRALEIWRERGAGECRAECTGVRVGMMRCDAMLE